MKIVRTYPPLDPDLLRIRARVDDQFPRAYIQNYDNSSLVDFKDDLVILEWDIAVALEDLEEFCWMASQQPDEVLTAPYRIYDESDPKLPHQGVYPHRVVTNPAPLTYRWVEPGDWKCDLFSFGMTYIPQELLLKFLADSDFQPHDRRLTDTNFSMWHYQRVGRQVDIAWNVHPVHLHYQPFTEWPRENA